MKNREIFLRDPATAKILNNGVAAVAEANTSKELETLRYELEHFVCEGQYKEGIIRILESYLSNSSATSQPAVWVSGFFGSGKSHLLKMLRHLWVNTKFPDGTTARELAHLPQEVKDLLKELDTLGRRCNGLHAVSGTLSTSGVGGVSLAILGIIFRSKGLPKYLPQAQFCLWLKDEGNYEEVKKYVEDRGRNFFDELRHLYVSPLLTEAVLSVDPDFAHDAKEARTAIRTQFPDVNDIQTDDFIHIVRKVLSLDGELPCTAIVLDEIQLFIGDDTDRSYAVQDVAEALSKQLDSRVLVIGAGQTALSGNLPLLQRLKDRFTIPVELSDSDVETVIRKVVLAKKADKLSIIEEMLSSYAGEIDRQLVGTRIAPRNEDWKVIVKDYPLLPVRRRFWEHVLRAVDTGTSSQLRTQLRIVHDAVREIADRPLGTVVPADFIFDQLQPDLLKTGVLLREIDETIRNLDDGTPEGVLAKRLCSLIFLIRKLPREGIADIGVRATAEMLADLLIADLGKDGVSLRKDVPEILSKLVEEGKLIKLDDEYSLQTRESGEWEREFRNRQARLNSDLAAISSKRSALINSASTDTLAGLKIRQGKYKQDRKLSIHFGSEFPPVVGDRIPVWIRDGWGESESSVVSDARAAGNDSPIIFVYIPKSSADDLKKAIVDYDAARATIDFKGTPTSGPGREARDAMTTRMKTAEAVRDGIIQNVISGARVFQGGGQERLESSVEQKILAAATASLDRLYPYYKDADDNRWSTVISRAKNGDEAAFSAIGWDDAAEKHPVCSRILSEIGSGKTGKQIRDTFEGLHYGWPRDAVDAGLITLFTTGHLRAAYKGTQLNRGQLDQAKISLSDFRVETTTVDVHSRLRLRKLFQTAELNCKSGEELSVSGQFLAKLKDLSERAGGNPPLPERPSSMHIDEMRASSGNEQLAAILEQYDVLSQQLKEWSALAELAEKRKSNWEKLNILFSQAKGLDGVEELKSQADAICNERRLLEEADPVPAIQRAVVKILREAMIQAHSLFKATYDQEMAVLELNDDWLKLSPEQRGRILEVEGISSVPALSVEDDDLLLRSLQAIPLSSWKTMTDALSQRFSNAAIAAARLLEPKTQKVKLASNTLKSADDVKNWVTKTEKELLDKIKGGPIIVS